MQIYNGNGRYTANNSKKKKEFVYAFYSLYTKDKVDRNWYESLIGALFALRLSRQFRRAAMRNFEKKKTTTTEKKNIERK